jgi:hypothetical protein
VSLQRQRLARSGRRGVPRLMILAVSEAPDYAFPHSAEDESRRLELLEQLLTLLRSGALSVLESARALGVWRSAGGEGRSPGGCLVSPARPGA